MKHIHYHVHKANHIVTIYDKWKSVPHVLAKIRAIPLNISHAQMTHDHTTLYLDTQFRGEIPSLRQILHTDGNEDTNDYAPSTRLPVDTKIRVYNLPNLNYTSMEFTCMDREGLLHDLMIFLANLPFDMHSAHITTIDTNAYNIIQLQNNGMPLTEREMEYVRNVFEYEGKERSKELRDPMY